MDDGYRRLIHLALNHRPTVIAAAAREEAWRTAFCIATDATGIPVLPEPREDGKRQPCHRGHYFVQIADRDHVFFEYARKETSAALLEMFAGYSGFIQADAKSVYDVLFREPDNPSDDDDGDTRVEVGCWSHARRKFWEATCTKSEIAREGLARIGYMFALEDGWRQEPSDAILRARRQYLRAHLEDFFAWAEVEYQRVRDQRGILRSALGYAVRQKDALMRILDDGRLHLENNRSERELRTIAVGRKGWLFVGSHDHGEAAGHIFSLVASARLHRLDPESYLRDLFRVLAHWPRDRYLELAPKYWARTRARLDPVDLVIPAGSMLAPRLELGQLRPQRYPLFGKPADQFRVEDFGRLDRLAARESFRFILLDVADRPGIADAFAGTIRNGGSLCERGPRGDEPEQPNDGVPQSHQLGDQAGRGGEHGLCEGTRGHAPWKNDCVGVGEVHAVKCAAGKRVADPNVAVQIRQRHDLHRVALGIQNRSREPEPELAEPDCRWIDIYAEDRASEDLASYNVDRSQISVVNAKRRQPFHAVHEKRARAARRIEHSQFTPDVNTRECRRCQLLDQYLRRVECAGRLAFGRNHQ